jgi:hypothetical protein
LPLAGVLTTTPAFSWVGWSVHARILPLIEQGTVFNSINFTLPYSAARNYTVATANVAIFLCPSEVNQAPTQPSPFFSVPHGVTSYGFNMGDWFVYNGGAPQTRGVFNPNRSRHFSELTDGLSYTMLAAE